MKFRTKNKITSIQVYEDTKRKLERRKSYQEESYDTVIRRLIDMEDIPSMEEMFKEGDKLKQKKIYATKEVVDMIHKQRERT